MLLGVLISVVITIVIGVALIPSIVDTMKEENPETPTGLAGFLDILVFVFIAVILFGAVAWIAGVGEGAAGVGIGGFGWISSLLGRRSSSWFLKNYLHKQSQKLGIQGSDIVKELGLTLCTNDCIDEDPLQIKGTQFIMSSNFAWYPIAKLEGYYKIVGLHRRHRNLNAAYLVGKKDGKPFALRFQDIKVPIEVCIKEVD